MLSYAHGLAGHNQQLASVIIKELLHYDILHALSQTSLRLPTGSQPNTRSWRFAEEVVVVALTAENAD